jgi:hypothetical protein
MGFGQGAGDEGCLGSDMLSVSRAIERERYGVEALWRT